MLTRLAKRRRKSADAPRRSRKVVNRLVENDLISRVSYDEYRDKVRDVYAGPKGALLAACSAISLHSPMGERLLRERRFDLAGVRNILDVGSGAGQITKHLLKYAPREAAITCCDLSAEMLRRARARLNSAKPRFLAADLTQLPFADATFDCVTCGYVLEHLPDPRVGLAEIARVLAPGGRMLLITTEDNFGGAWTSRVFLCRTYNRRELKHLCEELGLVWRQELWFSRMHRLFRAGGICVAIERQ